MCINRGENMAKKTQKERPVKVFRIGSIQASVFMNDVEKEGKKLKIPSISFQKRFIDDKGEWQTTNRLNVNDIPRAILVLNEAYRFLSLQERQSE